MAVIRQEVLTVTAAVELVLADAVLAEVVKHTTSIARPRISEPANQSTKFGFLFAFDVVFCFMSPFQISITIIIAHYYVVMIEFFVI